MTDSVAWVFNIHAYFQSIPSINYWERSIQISNCICGFAYFSFQLYLCFASYILKLLCLWYIHLVFWQSSWWTDSFTIEKWLFLIPGERILWSQPLFLLTSATHGIKFMSLMLLSVFYLSHLFFFLSLFLFFCLLLDELRVCVCVSPLVD